MGNIIVICVINMKEKISFLWLSQIKDLTVSLASRHSFFNSNIEKSKLQCYWLSLITCLTPFLDFSLRFPNPTMVQFVVVIKEY